jgi:energy-coupling factor transport system permease protein
MNVVMRARWLHPVAWWVWALSLAAAATRVTNPLLLALLIAAAAIVVARRKPDAPWGKSFEFFLALGALIIVIRVVFQVVFGAATGNQLLISLPGISLPTWMSGLRLGGPIMLESLLGAFYDGLRLATIAIVIGAANSLASPYRLLKAVPSALYELGVSIVVALSFIPQLISDAVRIRDMRRLRGRRSHGLKAYSSLAIPVLAGALDRSINLAASMDSRGYGRLNEHSLRSRRMTIALMLVSIVLIAVGLYGLFTSGAPVVMGLPALGLGAALAVFAMWKSGHNRTRSVYRPDVWSLPEYLVSGAGLMTLGIYIWANMRVGTNQLYWEQLHPALNQWPPLPLWGLVAFGISITPAFTSPPPPSTITSTFTSSVKSTFTSQADSHLNDSPTGESKKAGASS